MKTCLKIRKFVKWSGVAGTAMLSALWLTSGWFAAYWVGGALRGELAVVMAYGEIRVVYTTQVAFPRTLPADINYAGYLGLAGTFSWSMKNIEIPLWFLALLAAAPTSALFYFDRRTRLRELHNTCPHCSFSLAGLAAVALCPECGKARS